MQAAVPRTAALISILQQCRRKKDPSQAACLHAYMHQHRLESHPILGNHLVALLVDCGSLAEAQHVFDMLSQPNECSWTSLISGYIESGNPRHAFHLYHKMQRENCTQTTRYTFVTLLHTCARLHYIQTGLAIHEETTKRGFDDDLYVGSTLVDMYSKCGLLAEAQQVFNVLPTQDAVSWTALIAGYAEQGLSDEVLKCFKHMQRQGVSADAVTFVCSLKACGTTAALETGQEVHAAIILRGLEGDLYVASKLVDMYSKCGLLAEAQLLFDSLPVRNVVTWNAMLAGYVEHGPCDETLRCYKMMQLQSIPADAVTFVMYLKACGTLGTLRACQEIHTEIRNSGLGNDPTIGNVLVDMYGKCGSVAEGERVFNSMSTRDVVSWTALIKAYCENHEDDKALQCFEEMQEQGMFVDDVTFVLCLKSCGISQALDKGRWVHGEVLRRGFDKELFVSSAMVDMYGKCGSLAEAQQVFDKLSVANTFSWNALIAGYVDHGHVEEAFECFKHMQLADVLVDAVTLVLSLKSCSLTRSLEGGQKIHAEISKLGLDIDPLVGNMLIDMYGRCGSMAEVHQLFDKLHLQDIVSWTTMLKIHDERDDAELVIQYFEQMQEQGVSANATIFNLSLKACGTVKDLEMGQMVHSKILEQGFEKELYVGSTLVDMYGKCGGLVEAQHVFDRLLVKNSVAWNALITGYVEHGRSEEALNCFKCMQLEVVAADAVTFVLCLKACDTSAALETGKEIHAEICKSGLESDPFVANSLVIMYGKCGSITEGREVFDKIHSRDSVSWAAMVKAYCENEEVAIAVQCFTKMQEQGVAATTATFLLCLKACGILGALVKGQELHHELILRGWETEVLLASTIIDMYGKSSALAEAQKVFDFLLDRNAVSWNALIAGYAEQGFSMEVLKCFKQMQLEGVSADAVTFIICMKACGTRGAIEVGREIHAEIRELGLETDLLVGNTLINMYGRCGLSAEGQKVFDKLLVRDIVSWTAMIKAYIDNHEGNLALQCFEEMKEQGISADTVLIVLCLKACDTTQALDSGRRVHADVTHRGLENNLFVGSTLVGMYSKCGFLEEAVQVFHRLPFQNTVTWNALISGYAEYGLGDEVLSFFRQMQLERVSAQAVTYVLCLKACGTVGALEIGREIHAELRKSGLEKNIFVGNTLIGMYGKCGSVAEGREVFDQLPARDAVSWAALIASYAQHGLNEEILDCFKQMVVECVSVGASTFVLCLRACASLGALETGRAIHVEVRKSGLDKISSVGNMLIDMYATCGSSKEGREVFDKLLVRDVVSWTAMIKAHGENHEGNLAVKCFEEMEEQGVKPDSITFTCLLAACSHASLVNQGREYFEVMRVKYGIVPTIDHCACMIDLLARSGHVHEAERLLSSLKCPPSREILMAVLNGCKLYGRLELGQRCFQKLLEVNQEDASAYLLMADIYASAGRWSDANKVEKMRKDVQANKKPGSALVEVNQTLHEFIVGFNRYKVMSEIVESLSSYMKDEGYVPDLDLIFRHTSDAKQIVFVEECL